MTMSKISCFALDSRTRIAQNRRSCWQPSIDGLPTREETMLMLMPMKKLELTYCVIVSVVADWRR
jgi:hypothetical protein